MSLRIFHNFNKKVQNMLKILDLKLIAFLALFGDVCCSLLYRDRKYF
jgi:hypothetical protein